jgi:alanyl-tRNA synthetase
MRATPVQAVVRGLDEAKGQGFVAMFGEKYGERVRTLAVGEYSKELCGGTHVQNSGNIGAFRITSETAVAAGTRRIEAVTGQMALQLARQERQQLAELSQSLKVPQARVGARVQELGDELKRLRKELEQATAPDLAAELAKVRSVARQGGGAHSVVYARPGLQMKDAQELMKSAQKALEPMAGVLFSALEGEMQVVAVVSPALTAKVKAGDLVKAATAVLGGGGGGRPEMAQGKGKDGARLAEAEAAVRKALQDAGLPG